MVRVNDEQYWLYTSVDPATNRFLHVRLFPICTIPITERFLAGLTEKHDVADTVFLIDDARELEGALRPNGFSYRVESHGRRNPIERVFGEVERRIPSLSNCFSHVHPSVANSWLQTFAVWWDQC